MLGVAASIDCGDASLMLWVNDRCAAHEDSLSAETRNLELRRLGYPMSDSASAVKVVHEKWQVYFQLVNSK